MTPFRFIDWQRVRDDERSALIVAFANMTWVREKLPAKIETALELALPKLYAKKATCP